MPARNLTSPHRLKSTLLAMKGTTGWIFITATCAVGWLVTAVISEILRPGSFGYPPRSWADWLSMFFFAMTFLLVGLGGARHLSRQLSQRESSLESAVTIAETIMQQVDQTPISKKDQATPLEYGAPSSSMVDSSHKLPVEELFQLPEAPHTHVTYDPILGGFRRDPSPITHEPTDFERHILEEAKTPLDPPPTPQEIHEAEMNPWPGHTMRETILRNRGILSNEPPSMPMLQQQVAEPENQEPQPPYVSQQQDDPTVSTDQSPPAPSSEPPPTSYSEQLLPTQTPPEDHPAESDQQRYNSPRGDTTNEYPNN